MKRCGVLLVNVGTPDTPRPKDVRKYLVEFLTDERVMDIPWLQRQILVRGIIVPRRCKSSSRNYQRIWTKDGSPLKFYGKAVKEKLQDALGESFVVELAMRYQSPSIKEGLDTFKGLEEIVILPLFPQYASATTGSVHQKVMEVVGKWSVIPKMQFVNSYPTEEWMIEAFADLGLRFDLERYDHILFSFHGLPEKHVSGVDRSGLCLKKSGCCASLNDNNKFCYSAQCHATTAAIVERLSIPRDHFSISFQSRLGNDPWLKPYTQEVLHSLLQKKKKNVLVFSPAFVCDCLETIDEIGNEYKQEFLRLGGQVLDLVPGLNDHPYWIKALKHLVLESIQQTS